MRSGETGSTVVLISDVVAARGVVGDCRSHLHDGRQGQDGQFHDDVLQILTLIVASRRGGCRHLLAIDRDLHSDLTVKPKLLIPSGSAIGAVDITPLEAGGTLARQVFTHNG